MSFPQLSVLLVEDSADDYAIVRDLLQGMANIAVELEWLSTYDEAYVALRNERYDVCLLNYRPLDDRPLDDRPGGHTGLELLQKLVASTPTPIILLAGNEDYAVDVAAAKAGAADYLLKGHINAPLLDRSIRYSIEHKRTNEALRISEERYRAFVGNSTEAIWCYELEKPLAVSASEEEQIEWFYRYGYLSECNEAFAVLYGFSHQREMLGTRMSDLLVRSNPDNTEYLRACIRAHYRLSGAESCEVDRHGQTRYFLNNLVGIVENGWLHRVWGTQRDITERREAEAVRARLAAIVEFSEDAIISKNLDGIITTWNAAAQRLYGYSAQEAIGQPIFLIVPADRREETINLLDRNRRGKSVQQFETMCVCRTGAMLDISLSIAPLKNAQGQIVGDSSIHRDITQRKIAEEKLRASEANLATAQCISHLGSWELELTDLSDANANALRWSDEIFRIFGYEPGAFTPTSEAFLAAVHPEDKERVAAVIANAIATGGAFSVEHRIILPDGSERFVHSQAEMVFDPRGQPLKMVGVGQDVTQSRQAEQQLRQNEEQLNSIYNAVGDVLFYLKVEAENQFRFVSVNQAFGQLTGMEPSQVLGKLVSEVIPEPVLSMALENYREAVAQNKMVNWKEVSQYPNGTLTGEVSVSPVLDENGVCTHLVGSVHDVTKCERAEQALRQSERELRELAAQLEDQRARLVAAQSVAKIGSWEIELATGRVLWSQENYRIFEIEREEFDQTQTGFLKFVHADDRADLHEAFEQSLESTHSSAFEHRIVVPSGEIKFVEERWQIVRDDTGTPLRAVGTMQDITERKQASAQLQYQKSLLEAQAEASPDGILVISSEGKLLDFNQRYAQMWGLSDEIIRSGDNAMFRQAVLEKVRNPAQMMARVQHLYAHPEELSRDEILLLDGRVFDRYSAPITNADHGYYGRVWYFRDITEREQAEQALRLSDERFTILSRATNDAMWDWDLKTDALWWNEGFETLFGYDRGEIEPSIESWSTHIHPDDLERITDSVHQAIESGWQSWEGEYSFRCADGSYSAIFDRGFIIHDENQRPIRMVGSMQDITKRKRDEEELRTSEEKFQSIVANVPGMVYQFERHPNGAISWPFVSKGCLELFEVEPDEIKRNPDLTVEMIHPDDKSDFERSLQASDYMMLPWVWEGRLQMRSGKIKWVQGASSSQALPDGGVLCTGLLMDITARKEAEKQRDHFFTMSLDMMGIIGSDGYLQRVNPAFIETLGYSESELLETPFRERVHPEDREATELAAQNLIQGVPLTDLVNRYRAKNGAWRWLEWRSVAAPDEGVIYAAARDITSRKEAESALCQMRDELEDRVIGRTAELAQSNISLQEEIGRREQAMRETRARARQQEAVSELGRRALSNIDLDILFNGATALISATLDADVCSILEILPSAESFLVRAGVGLSENLVGQAEISAEMGTPAGHALHTGESIIIADVREEMRFEIDEMARRQGVISSMHVVIQSDEMPFGVLCAGSTKGRAFTQHDVHSLEAMANVLAAAIERHRIESEIRLLNTQLEAANEQLRIENIERVMTLAVLREGAVVLQRARDDAEHARENAEHANLAKSEFLSRMSHELRTPLNAILGFGQILEMRNREVDIQQQDNIQQILKAGRHLLDLINEVLDIARIEAGHLSLSPEPTIVGHLIREAVDMIRPLALQRRIEIFNERRPDQTNQYVLADQQRLKQVILNLLSNAVKYNRDDGQVNIFCATTQSNDGEKIDGEKIDSEKIDGVEPAHWLRLSIRDTGLGLSSKEISCLFVPFERLSAVHTQVEGTGIGLALCKRLVEAMNGRIGVDSVRGQGSTFWVELPLVEVKGAVKGAVKGEVKGILGMAADGIPAAHPMTVLYIEDNISNISLIKHVLADLSTQITLLPAMQGSLGLEMASQHKPDMILLDVNLPDISGEIVLNRLKANPVTQNIPVVVLSADATPRQMENLLSSGAVHYLTKPLDVEQFLKVLTQTLGNRRPTQK